jgi:hypothetical protein
MSKKNDNAAKGAKFNGALRRALAKKRDDERASLDLIAERLVDKAIDGNMESIKEVADRLDGKVKASVEIEGAVKVTSVVVRELVRK